MPQGYTGYYDEERLRGIPSPQAGAASPAGNYSAPYSGLSPDGVTPININQGTYTNGRTFAGTGNRSNPGGGNVPMSDQAYNLLMSNLGQIPTDRDVLGGGNYGIRGWLHDHPEGTIAAFIAAAAGGGALAGGAGAGGAGGAGGGIGSASAAQGAIGADAAVSGVGSGVGGALGGAGAIDWGGGTLGTLAQNYLRNQGQSALAGGAGGQGGGAPQMPPGMFGSQVMTPQPRQAPAAQRPVLPGMQQLPQAVGRRPYNFRGTTIWM